MNYSNNILLNWAQQFQIVACALRIAILSIVVLLSSCCGLKNTYRFCTQWCFYLSAERLDKLSLLHFYSMSNFTYQLNHIVYHFIIHSILVSVSLVHKLNVFVFIVITMQNLIPCWANIILFNTVYPNEKL